MLESVVRSAYLTRVSRVCVRVCVAAAVSRLEVASHLVAPHGALPARTFIAFTRALLRTLARVCGVGFLWSSRVYRDFLWGARLVALLLRGRLIWQPLIDMLCRGGGGDVVQVPAWWPPTRSSPWNDAWVSAFPVRFRSAPCGNPVCVVPRWLAASVCAAVAPVASFHCTNDAPDAGFTRV